MTKPKRAFAEAYAPADAPASPRAEKRTATRVTRAMTLNTAGQASSGTRAIATGQANSGTPTLRHDVAHLAASASVAASPSAAFVVRDERPTLPENLFGEQRIDVATELPTAARYPWESTADVATAPAVEDLSWLEDMNRAAAGLALSETAWEPALEVPHFAWPAAVVELLSAIERDVHHLLARWSAQDGDQRRVIFFAGGGAGAGCTTTVLTVARAAANAGCRVVLVDADLADAALAESLGLRVETGWSAALESGLPLGDVLIESLEDRVVVAPLAAPVSRAESLSSSSSLAPMWRELADRFDLVLVDAGSLTRGSQVAALIGEGTPAELVFVQDTRRPAPQELNHALRCFPNLRACPISVVQNFVRG